MTEALEIQLDNVTHELQALQVEIARLREANPKLASVIDAQHKELEELQQNLYDSWECEIQAKQEKGTVERELASIKEKLVETEETCKSEKAARNKADRLLKEAQTDTELRNTMGMLRLQLKCALNEKELCEYRLVEARNKACMHVSVQQSAQTHEVSLRNGCIESPSTTGSNSAPSRVTSEAGISSTEIRTEGEWDDEDVTPIQDTQAAIIWL